MDTQELSDTSLEVYETVAKITSKKSVLFLFSSAIVWVTLSTYNLYQISLESITIFLFVLTIYTLIPVQFGYSDLIKPFVRIVLDDGTEHEGILQKMGKFVVVTTEEEEKTVSINSNKIIIIEGKMVMDKNVTK